MLVITSAPYRQGLSGIVTVSVTFRQARGFHFNCEWPSERLDR